MHLIASLAVGLLLVSLPSCTVGPTYQPPQPKMPENWQSHEGKNLVGMSVDAANWWTNFDDPHLTSLIERASKHNLDLKLAQERTREARAARGARIGELLPHIDSGGTFSRARQSQTTAFRSNFPQEAGIDPYSNTIQAGFDASWEIDIFGGLRSEVAGAQAEIEASQESFRDVLVSLVAEVARNYIEYRGFSDQLRIADKNIEAQREVLSITKARFEAGLVSELDVAQAQAQLSNTEAQVPLLEHSISQARNRVSVLLGENAGTIIPELQADAALPRWIDDLPAGVPSDLLRRRPDIRRAEREVAAANAQLGVAMAELFPRFSLTGSFGLQSEKSSHLGDSESKFWSFGPAIRWPLFAGGSIRSRIEAQDARLEQAAVRYEQTVLAALEDVERALSGYFKGKVRYDRLRESAKASARAVELANQLYQNGAADFVRVLDAERTLYEREDQLSQSQRQVITNLISVYKALGGGWDAG